jgi:hypothetical protein
MARDHVEVRFGVYVELGAGGRGRNHRAGLPLAPNRLNAMVCRDFIAPWLTTPADTGNCDSQSKRTVSRHGTHQLPARTVAHATKPRAISPIVCPVEGRPDGEIPANFGNDGNRLRGLPRLFSQSCQPPQEHCLRAARLIAWLTTFRYGARKRLVTRCLLSDHWGSTMAEKTRLKWRLANIGIGVALGTAVACGICLTFCGGPDPAHLALGAGLGGLGGLVAPYMKRPAISGNGQSSD